VQTATLIVGLGILAVIAYGDMRSRRIPNVLSLAIAILGLLRIMLVHDPVTAGHTLAAGGCDLHHRISALLVRRHWWRGRKISCRHGAACRLPRLIRVPFPHEPLRRSARARQSGGGKVRSVFQTLAAGVTRILNRPERPRSSGVKRVDSTLWGRRRRCWCDYADSSKVNSRARENDTYSIVFCLAGRCRDSRPSGTAAAHERRYSRNEGGNTCRCDNAADRHIVACQGRDLAADWRQRGAGADRAR